MQMDLHTTTIKPFVASERPGAVKGPAPTKLSDLDRSGVVFKQAKHKDRMPHFTASLGDLPGLKPKAEVKDDAETHHTKLEFQARQLIGQTFFGTMLRQMRESPFKSDLFEGGRGGQAFSSLYDQKLVEQMSRGAGKKLVASIIRKFEGNKAYQKQIAGVVPSETGQAVERPTSVGTSAVMPRNVETAMPPRAVPVRSAR